MKALIIGEKARLQRLIADELKAREYEVFLVPDRSALPEQDFDVCVDLAAGGIRDVRRIAEALRKTTAHYILLSSCLVYPPAPRPFPWQPEHIDLCDETGFRTVDRRVRRYRAAERELHHLGTGAMDWTILRPSFVAAKDDPDANHMRWFVSRILDGGPIVLPDDDDPLFRHVADRDLAGAVGFVAGKKESFYQTVHVTGSALFSVESYARLLMRAMDRETPVVRVAGLRWQAAGLKLPMEGYLQRSFMDDSPLLAKLGWRAMGENDWIPEYAGFLADRPLPSPAQRERELALLDPPAQPEPVRGSGQGHWHIVGKPGAPCSFRVEYPPDREKLTDSRLRPRRLAVGMAEEQLLAGMLPGRKSLVMGRNVLLELVDPRKTGLEPGCYLPVAQRPCGEPSCPSCAVHPKRTAGIDVDGFGAEMVAVPPEHLVPVPAEEEAVALLADPLACLLAVVPALLAETAGPVWVFGDRVEALLALLLVREAGHTPVHISRSKNEPKTKVVEFETMELQRAWNKTGKNTLARPAMAINLSGSADGENLLVRSLADKGFLVTPFASTQSKQKRVNVRLPLVAPGRMWLEQAVAMLAKWSSYDLASLLLPVSLEMLPDLFISGQFRQRFVDLTGEDE